MFPNTEKTEKEHDMNQRFQILPDVYLTAIQTKKFKTGCFSINFLRPMRHEEAAKNALIPSVLLRGSQHHRDIRAISARLDELYGSSIGTLVRKKGEVQLTGFFADFIEDELVGEPVFQQMADFAAELLLEPLMKDGHFLTATVLVEKKNLENAIEGRINDKRGYATWQLLQLMCPGEAYGIARTGELEDAQAITPENLTRQYYEVLTNSQVELFYMGAKAPEEAAEIFRQRLQSLPRGKAVTVGTQVVRQAGELKTRELAMDVTQGKLSIGLRTGCTVTDPDYPALLLMNAIFGGSITSKLFAKVREEMSLCYYASSAIEKFKGVMIISSGIAFDQYETAKNEILRQLEECKAGNISDDEFASAKRYILSELKIAMDSPGRLDDYQMGQVVAGLSGTMEDLSNAIAAVTQEQVAQAARNITLDSIFFLKGGELA